MSFAELVPVWAWPRRQTLYVPRDADRQAFRGAGDMKTRAAVLGATGAPAPYETSKPLVVEELVLDPPGPGEVLVRIKAAGLCHSDLSVINGDRPRPLPMALGHEAAGIVEEGGGVGGGGRARGGRDRGGGGGGGPPPPRGAPWGCPSPPPPPPPPPPAQRAA